MVGTCMLLMLATGDWPRRVGEAAHPGPPSDDPELRRQRVLHALGQMQLLPPDTRPAALRDHHTDADAVETLSDTLSATTAFASPRGDAPQPLSGAMAPMAPDEATPGFTPPPSPDQQTLPGLWTRTPALARCPPAEHRARRAKLLAVRASAARSRGQLDGTCPPSLVILPTDRPSFRPARVHPA